MAPRKARRTTKSAPQEAPASAEFSDKKRPPVPTDDEIGAALLSIWDGNYAYFWGTWYHYQDGVWRQETGIEKLIWDALVAAKFQGYRPTSAKQKSVEAYLRAQLRVPDERIDCQDQLINLCNGVYNYETGQLEAHQREFYLTTQLDFAYDPEAECPVWLRCLDQWLTTPEGEPDRELQQVVQEYMGYCLTPDTAFQVALLLYGPAAGGKSQIINVAQALLGDGHVSLNLGELDRNPYQLADVLGKRLITCTETDSQAVLKDAEFKQLVSGEEMAIRQIYRPTFRYQPIAKVMWAMNELPRNLDRSNAIYRRLLLVPVHRAIPEEQRDPHLGEKLLAELPGIFNWCLEGLARLSRNGKFTQAAQVAEQVQAYRMQNDVEANFLADQEWIIPKPGALVQATLLYIVYKVWCERNGERPQSRTRVAAEWKRLGLVKEARRDANYYVGIEFTAMAAAIASDRQR